MNANDIEQAKARFVVAYGVKKIQAEVMGNPHSLARALTYVVENDIQMYELLAAVVVANADTTERRTILDAMLKDSEMYNEKQ